MLPPSPSPSTSSNPDIHRPFLVTSSSFSSAVLSSSPTLATFNPDSYASIAASPSPSIRRRLSTFPPDTTPAPKYQTRSMSSTLAIQGAIPLEGGEGERELVESLPGGSGEGSGSAEKSIGGMSLPKKKLHISKPSVPAVNPLAILTSLLAVSNGRDKVLKMIQYTLKLHLLIRRSPSSLAALLRKHLQAHLPGLRHTLRKPFGTTLDKRLKKTASGLSLTRRCLLLGNGIPSLLELFSLPLLSSTFLLSQKGQSTLFTTLLDLANCLANDVNTFGRLGLFSERVEEESEEWSNRLWLLEILINLSELSKTRLSLTNQLDSLRSSRSALQYEQLPSFSANWNEKTDDLDDKIEALEKKRVENGWASRKLYMDLTFVSCEWLPLKGYKDSAQILSGFASGIIATRKLVLAHHAKLAKS